ncbi:MAG: hypothetical protein JW990_17105 [Thermoleophilia bacterium]|nr:hypothetical protein [Thermoleophilia bacterium]
MMASLKHGSCFGPHFLPAAVLLLVGLLALGGCGEDETASTDAGSVIDQIAAAKMDMAEFDRLVIDTGERLITQLSGDVAASCAVLLALDRGYDAYQMLTGALNDRVGADGRILAVDGSVLAPARPAEGFIEITADANSDGGEARTGLQAEPILLACLSKLVLADETTFPEYWAKNARVFENRRTLLELLGVFEDHAERMRELEEREALKTQQALEAEAKRKAQEKQLKREAAWNQQKTTETLIWLVTDGYSAEQILEAVLLGECEPTWPDDFIHVHWKPTHPSGGVLRPAHQPVMLSGGPRSPVVDPSAPADYDPKHIEVALAGGDPGTTTTQPQTANTPPAAEDIITSTTPETPIPITLKGTDADGDDLTYTYEQPANGVAEGAPPFLTYTPDDGFAGATDTFPYTVSDGEAQAVGTVRIEVEAGPDRDGIQDGLYVGEVYTITTPDVPIWEIPESTVELEVTDQGIAATVEYVQRWAKRHSSTRGVLCIATIHVLYHGQGQVADPLSLTLEAVELEIVSIEGTECGAGGDWDRSAEESILADFATASFQTCTLAGKFSDGHFEGSITSVHGVRAAIGE